MPRGSPAATDASSPAGRPSNADARPRLEDLQVGAFGSKSLRAVDDVSFTVEPGKVVALIGESGSGKSTIGRMILGLTRITEGRITFQGHDVEPSKDYYRSAQGVFQDPFSSFNPVFKVDHVFATVREGFFPHESNAA